MTYFILSRDAKHRESKDAVTSSQGLTRPATRSAANNPVRRQIFGLYSQNACGFWLPSGGAMKVLASAVAILALLAVSAEAQQANCRDPVHYSVPNQVDNGRTIELSNGGFQTTYADGWSHASEPDSTFGKGGRRTTDKDNTGAVRAITKCDAHGVARQKIEAEVQNGVTVRTTTSWNAAGAQISKDTKPIAANTSSSPSPQGQAQPVQTPPPSPPPGYPSAGGPPPPGPPPGDQTMNGPPPGYDPNSSPPPGYDPNGPPPGYDSGPPPPGGPPIGIGGFGFSFGTRHKF